MQTLVLALDWTPNVLHAGILYAYHQGWYAESDMQLVMRSTEEDDYKKKPIQKVVDGEAHLCIGPSEHLICLNFANPQATPLRAVATVLQCEKSAFAVKKSKNIRRPAEFDKMRYLGYATPLEEEILKAMIIGDGGEGTFSTLCPPRLQVWDRFLDDQGDLCWIFIPWEGVRGEQQGFELLYYKPTEWGVPYGYSSVLMARAEASEEERRAISTFLAVSEKGYQAVTADIAHAAEYLCSHVEHRNFSSPANTVASLRSISDGFLTPGGRWGKMNKDVWDNWLSWMRDRSLTDLKEIPESRV